MYVREKVQTRHLTRQNERPHDTSGSERVGEHIEADAAGETHRDRARIRRRRAG